MAESTKRPSVAPEHRDSLADIYGSDSPELESLSTVFEEEELFEDDEPPYGVEPPDMQTGEIVAVLRKSLHPVAPQAEPGPWTRVPVSTTG